MKKNQIMFNKKAMAITIAALLAILAIGSASAAGRSTNPGFAPGEYNPGGWGNSELQLRNLIRQNNVRIAQLQEIIQQSRTTEMTPGSMATVHAELNQLERQNRLHQRKLDRITGERSYRTKN